MSLSLHAVTVPVFQQMLGNAVNWLEKAAAHAEARRFDPAVYLTMRLAPDMLPFPRQVQIATDNAKGCVARLAGQEVPAWADDEDSLEALKARLRRAVEYVGSVPASAFDGAEAREIVLPMRRGDPLRFDGRTYALHFALPNVYFHLTTTYALLRHAGVDLGKTDYLGAMR